MGHDGVSILGWVYNKRDNNARQPRGHRTIYFGYKDSCRRFKEVIDKEVGVEDGARQMSGYGTSNSKSLPLNDENRMYVS